MSAQFDAVSALRKRAMSAAGWDAAWPVAYAGQPFTPPAVRQFIDESIVGGPGVPVAITPPSYVFYRYTGQWQLLFIAPPAFGSFATLAMAEGVVQEVMRAGLELPDGTPILVRSLDVGPDVPVDGDVQRALVISYEFTIAISMAALVPTTPSQLRQQLSSQQGTSGAVVVFHAVPGFSQTVVPNGDSRLADPTFDSATGYWCIFWDDSVVPGAGKHLRPDPTLNHGNGEPCTPIDTTDLTKGAYSAGIGLYHPASLGYDGSGSDFHTDAAVPANPSDQSTWIPNSGGLDNVHQDLSAGVCYGGIAKWRLGSFHLRVGVQGDPTCVEVNTNMFNDWQATSDPILGLENDYLNFGIGTPPIHWGYHAVDTLAGLPYGTLYFDRALAKDDFRSAGTTVQSAGRDVHWGADGGNVFNAACAHYERYILAGVFNAAQRKTFADWTAARYPTRWSDPRRRGIFAGGDSFDSAYQAKTDAQALVEGLRNLPRIPNTWFTCFARSGNNVTDQYRFTAVLKTLDLSQCDVLDAEVGEWINDSAGRSATLQLQRNFFWGDAVLAISPKIRLIYGDAAYSQTTNKVENDPAIKDGLTASAVTPHGATFVEDRLESLFYDPYHFGDGSITGQIAGLWDHASNHPAELGQEYWAPMRQIAYLKALGDDVSARVYKLQPADIHLDFTVGDAARGTTWSFLRWDKQPLSAGPLTYAILDKNAVDASAIATVDINGLVTPVSAGQCLLRALSADGGEGVCVINVTGGAGDGSIADVAAAFAAAGLTLDYIGDPAVALVGGAAPTSLPDARGGAFTKSLDTVAGAPTQAGGIITLDAGAKMQSALDAAFDMSRGQCGFVLLGTEETDNVYVNAGYDSGANQWGIGSNGGKWALGTNWSLGISSVLGAVSATPRLGISEFVKDAPTAFQAVGLKVYGELSNFIMDVGNPPAGTTRLFVGGAGRVQLRGILSWSGGALTLGCRQALARWATARGVDVTALESTKAQLVIGPSDTNGAGTTTPATDAWPVKLLAEMPAAYARRTYPLITASASFPELDAALKAIVIPQIDPALRTVYWVLIEASLYDQFLPSPVSTATAIAAIQECCDLLHAIGVHVRVGVTTIPDNGTATQGGNGWYQTVNTAIRALVGSGHADAVLDMQANGWNAATLGNGESFNTATSQAIADAWHTLMAGVEV